MENSLKKKLAQIKLFITDVDGVLTNGSLYYTNEGLVMKKFQVKDGMGTRLLKESGIKTALISTDTSELMKLRGERLKMDFIHIGSWDKDQIMLQICDELKIKPKNVGFIGDDVNDLEVLKKVGFAACPNDAVEVVKKVCHYICKKKGGDGAYREVADLILKYKKD